MELMVNTPSPSFTAAPAEASSQRDWAIAVAALASGTLCFGLIFFPEIAAAVQVWMNSDAYAHCFLILPVAAYLAWDCRQSVAATTPRPVAWVAVPAIFVAVTWFIADRLGIMEARQLMAMTLFQLMVLSIIGPQTWRALSAPLLYLFFLVPFGEFVVTPLQSLVVHFTTVSLNLLGIPNFSDGITIEIPEGTFLVHQACSGLRFLIASAAFGALFSCVMFTSPLRRVLFIMLSLAVAIIGNCLRVVGIILIAHFIGNAEAVETGHVLWGWLFYLLIGSVLVLIGLKFRQESRSTDPRHSFGAGRTLAPSAIALVIMIVLATAPAIAANYLDRRDAGEAGLAPINAPPLPGCAIVRLPSGPSHSVDESGADRLGKPHSSAYRCGEDVFLVTLRRYSPGIGVRPLFSSVRAAATLPESDLIVQTGDMSVGRGQGASLWRVAELSTEKGFAAVATGLWLNGRSSGTGIRARITQALNSVQPSPLSPVMVTIAYTGGTSVNNAERAIYAFLQRTGPLSELVGRSVLTP
ncbi:MAG: exosortase [Deltaproteobacteria bacterium]|nr:exosortase [Deltaproteobacteria bacterium]